MVYETINNNIYNFPKKLPYITVSAKGISNGLSTIINDGADFGPDTYLNTSSKNRIGPPYSQTSGIQEALNYAQTIALYFNDITGYVLPSIKLLTGIFNLNSDISLPYFSQDNNIPSFTLLGEGSGYASPTQINTNGNNIILGNSNGIEASSGGFLIQGIQFYNNSNNLSSLQISGYFNYNSNSVIRDISLNNIILDLNGLKNMNLLNIDNVFSNSYFNAPLFINHLVISQASFLNGIYLNNTYNLTANFILGGLNLFTGSNININEWVIPNNQSGITNLQSQGSNSTTYINVNTLLIDSNSSFFNGSTNNGIINLKLHINNLILQNNMNFANSSNINIQDFTINEITNGTQSPLSSFNLPIFSSISGTTSGTINLRFIKYSQSYKKLIIYFNNYENNTSTNQSINYPLPFNSYAIITANNTGLTINTTTTGITITTPNSTTTYNGIVIVEGY